MSWKGQKFYGPGFVLDIDKALNISKGNEIFQVLTEDLRSFVAPKKSGAGTLPMHTKVDKDYAQKVNSSKPILMAEIEFNTGEKIQLVIDGNHRLYKRLEIEKSPMIDVQFLTLDQLIQVIDPNSPIIKYLKKK